MLNEAKVSYIICKNQNGTVVPIKAKPSDKAKTIGNLGKGQKVVFRKETGLMNGAYWYEVTCKNGVGYVSKYYTKIGDIAQPAKQANASPSSNVLGAANGLKIAKYLRDVLGLNQQQVIGVLASLYQECKFNPKASCGTSTAYGICQWTSYYNGKRARQCSMCNYINKKYYGGKLVFTERKDKRLGITKHIPLNYQLEWMNVELKTTHARVLTALKKATNAKVACDLWTKSFEATPDLKLHSQWINKITKFVNENNLFKTNNKMTLNEEKVLRGVIREMVDEFISDFYKEADEARKKHHKHKSDSEKRDRDKDRKDDGKPGHESDESTGRLSKMRKNVIDALKNEYTDCAPYFYKLWPDKDESNARSLGIKCRDGELNDNGVPYSFSDDEIIKLHAMLNTNSFKK